jgi:hypothetical protein
MSVAVGYLWGATWASPEADLGDRLDEHRTYGQWQYAFRPFEAPVELQVRTRLEQRLRPSVGDDVGHRVRQMVRGAWTFTPGWLAVVWDEAFFALNDTDWKQRAGYDQNRLFAGFGHVVVPGALRLELGYFNQHLRRLGNPSGDLVNHAAMLNTYVSW